MYRPTYIKIDGNILENNIKNIISNYPDYKYYIGVVKNNAYHHGIYAIKYLINSGVNYLAVSSLEEALQARKYNSTIPILVLEPIKSEYIFDAISNNITLTIGSLEEAARVSKLKISDDLKIHLKIDSGMNRLGFKNKKDLKQAFDILSEIKHVEVEGIYTHLATSGIQDPKYNEQVSNFKEIVSPIDLNKIPIIHVDRSLTFSHHEKLDFCNGVRMGIAMYGFEQNISAGNFINSLRRRLNQRKFSIENVPLNTKLSLDYAFSLYSEVMEVRVAKKGEFCGYGMEYVFKEESYVATIPVGYADGVTKSFGFVYINGKRYKIIAECMDMIMVEVDKSVHVGDVVEIIGKNQNIKTIGNRLGLSGYKALNIFTTRVPIVYEYNGETIEIKY